MTTANAACGDATVRIAATRLLANDDEAFLGLLLRDIAVVRDRNVSRGRRQRAESLNGHGWKLGEVDFFALFQGDDGLLPVHVTTSVLRALAAGLAPDV